MKALRGHNAAALVDPTGRPLVSAPRAAAQSPYEGAGAGRRAGSWYAPGSGPAATVAGNLATLRNRTRAGYRNIPWIRQAIDRRVSNEVGCGLVPRSRAPEAAFRERIHALFEAWAAHSDPSGELNIYGQQAQLANARNQSGEVFARLRYRRLGDGLEVPLQLQILEADHVPEAKTEALSNGNAIVSGVEFDGRGRRVAYWMHREHPAEHHHGARFDGMPRRVPAAEVLHSFLPIRPGQVRGEPVSVPALLKTHTFDSYDDAELVRKQTRAPYTGFLHREEYEADDYLYDPFTGQALSRDADQVATLDAQPGTFLSGLPGEGLTLFGGDDSGTGYADFMHQQLLSICAGHGVPYELVTGDWSKVNDRLVRQILNEFRRGMEMLQDHLMVHQVCRPLWEAFVDAAVWAGAVAAPGYATRRAEYLAHEWRPHAWPYVHPEQDINAKLKAIAGNLTSRDAVVAESGWDAEDIDRQNVEGEQRLRALRREAGLPEEPKGP